MTLHLDDRAIRRLAVVRQIFLTAERAARDRGNPVAGMMAVVGFDLAIETLLKAFVAAADTEPRKERTIHEILKKCDSLLESKGLPALPLRAHVLQVHTSRNSVQHDAQFPHSQVVDDARVYVHGFCQQFAFNVWGADFDFISLVDMVQDELTRRVLQQATDDVASGNLLRGLALIYHAFLCACDFPFLGSFFSASYLSSRVDGLTPAARKEIVGGLKSARNDAVTVSAMMAATSSLGDLNRLLSIVPWMDAGVTFEPEHVTYNMTLEWQGAAPDPLAASWAVNFVVDSIVSWQQQGLPALIANRKDYVALAGLLLIWDEQNRSLRIPRRK